MKQKQKFQLYAITILLCIISIAFLIKGIQKNSIAYVIVSIVLAILMLTRIAILRYLRKHDIDNFQ